MLSLTLIFEEYLIERNSGIVLAEVLLNWLEKILFDVEVQLKMFQLIQQQNKVIHSTFVRL